MPDMAVAPSPASHVTRVQYDAERLAKQKYWTTSEAAFALGYTAERYKQPYNAFYMLCRRNGIRPGYVGRRLVFLRVQFDAQIARAQSQA